MNQPTTIEDKIRDHLDADFTVEDRWGKGDYATYLCRTVDQGWFLVICHADNVSGTQRLSPEYAAKILLRRYPEMEKAIFRLIIAEARCTRLQKAFDAAKALIDHWYVEYQEQLDKI